MLTVSRGFPISRELKHHLVARGVEFVDVSRGFPISSTPLATVYRLTGRGWTRGTAMPTPRADLAAAWGADDMIYAIGGSGRGGPLAVVESYDPQTNRWTRSAPLPEPLCCMAAVRLLSGQIDSIGGQRNGQRIVLYGPSVSLSQMSSAAGDTIVLSGTNFAAHANVYVYWGPAWTGTLLGNGMTDGAGTLTTGISITIPPSVWETGSYVITAVDDQSRYPGYPFRTTNAAEAANRRGR